MSALSTEQKPDGSGPRQDARAAIEARLAQLEQDDYVMPGWKTEWSELDGAVLVLFQLVHRSKREAMTEEQFRLWIDGWSARRAAVMARRPRRETIPQRTR